MLTGLAEDALSAKNGYDIQFDMTRGVYFLEKNKLSDGGGESELAARLAEAVRVATQFSKAGTTIDPASIVAALQKVKGQDDNFQYIAETLAGWMRRRKKPLNFFTI